MFFVLIFGFLMMLLSMIMIVRPKQWADGIVRFSKYQYFHQFEIVSRGFFGVLFVIFGKDTFAPNLISGIGWLLILVSFGLLLIGPDRHKKFARWSAQKFEPTFRPAGTCSLAFGLFLTLGSFL